MDLSSALSHIVYRQGGHRGGGERLHFDAGLPGGGGAGDNAHALLLRPSPRRPRGTASADGTAESGRDVRLAAAMPAMRAISSGLPLGFSRQFAQHRGRDAHEGVGARRSAACRGLAETSTMRGLPAESKCESFFISRSTRMSSPRAYSRRDRDRPPGKQLARVRAGMSPEPCQFDRRHLAPVRAEARRQKARQPGAMAEIAGQARQRHGAARSPPGPASSSSAARAKISKVTMVEDGIARQSEEKVSGRRGRKPAAGLVG